MKTDLLKCALKTEENRNKKLFCIDKVIRTDKLCFIDGSIGDIDLQVDDIFYRYKNTDYYRNNKNQYCERTMKIDFPISIKIDRIISTLSSSVKIMPSYSITRLQVSGKDIDELTEGMLLIEK